MSGARHLQITLVTRRVSGIVALADDTAPKTAELVWQSLPIEGPVWHAKYANNEIYTLVEPLCDEDDEPGMEAATVFPIPGDVCYFRFPPGFPAPRDVSDRFAARGSVDLALFYGRDNFLLGPAGLNPGNVFGSVVEGLDQLAEACEHVFRHGSADETLRFAPA